MDFRPMKNNSEKDEKETNKKTSKGDPTRAGGQPSGMLTVQVTESISLACKLTELIEAAANKLLSLSSVTTQ